MDSPRQHPPPQAPNVGKPGYRRIPRNSLIAELHSVAGRIISPPRYDTVPRMDQLPVEILHEIFGYACTDGSRTACSLSLVSRRIHAASRATHFTSVLLIDGSLETLTKFLNRFQRARETALAQECPSPRVQHLCILVDPVTSSQSLWGLFGLPERMLWTSPWLRQMWKEQDSRTRDEWLAFVAELETKYHHAVSSLLSLVATDLETLCLLQTSPSIDKHPYRLDWGGHNFPKLRELWCCGDLPSLRLPIRWNNESSKPDIVPFPVLTRFHILVPTRAEFARWQNHAPNVESFRIILGSAAFERPDARLLPGIQDGLSKWSLVTDWRTAALTFH